MLVGRKYHPRRGLGLALRLCVLPLLAACGPQRLEKAEQDLRAAIAEAGARGDTATVRLFIEVPFAFDSVHVAAPGAGDDSHVFTFDVRGELYPVRLPRSVADVAPELTGRVYGPDSAVFRVSRAAGSAVPVLLPR